MSDNINITIEDLQEQKIFSAAKDFYGAERDSHFAMRLCIRMRDFISVPALQAALDKTIVRFPYFLVRMGSRRNEETGVNEYYFMPNANPVRVHVTEHCVPLGGGATKGHFLAVCCYDNWIYIELFHALTDGQGCYNFARILLNHYCKERYDIDVSLEGINNMSSEVVQEEWDDPIWVQRDALAGVSPDVEFKKAFQLPKNDNVPTAFGIIVNEKEFMGFSKDNDGSPCTVIALMLARAIASVHRDDPGIEDLKLLMSVNMRPAVGAPLAHQTLVKDIELSFPKKMHDMDFDMQSTIFRGKTILNSDKSFIHENAAWLASVSEKIVGMKGLKERVDYSRDLLRAISDAGTALVSYVGKAGFRDSEDYIRDFRSWVGLINPLIIEVGAINSNFYIDFMQQFSSVVYVEAFVKELENAGIHYDLTGKYTLETPHVVLPWTEDCWHPYEL